jgi:alkanesulfonate monooxygenase SsuD/methylene tetrahydromethanopterin reductase-like flavin-dependent oxidoreductase (luciferase family)
MFAIGLTDHIEGPRERASEDIYREIEDLVVLADEVGVKYAWFSEHHAHIHEGHLPTPLLLALHLAGKTRRIALGTAIICLNLHHALDVAEQVSVADLLSKGRMAVGFGSGSTPEESGLFGLNVTGDDQRHDRFESALRAMLSAWDGQGKLPMLPRAAPDLAARCWIAVNSVAAAQIAGRLNFNMLFSHLRTPEQYRQYSSAYRKSGGERSIAANRPVFVGPDDAGALALAEPALRILWRRFRAEGKIGADVAEPTSVRSLCGHPINFIVGGAETVARQLMELHAQAPFDVANIEVRWAGLGHDLVKDSLRRFMCDVMARIEMIGPQLGRVSV